MNAPVRPGLRLASYNTEWFNALFDDTGRAWDDGQPSARYQITRRQQLAALGRVFQALDADGIMVIEAPDTGSRRSTVTALEGFAARFGLRARRCIHGFPSETEQEIAFLHDPDRLTVEHSPEGPPATTAGVTASPGTARFDTAFRYDLDTDHAPDLIRFSKPPLELTVRAGDQSLRLIGVHAKSKAPHGATDPAHLMRLSIQNRRKQLAQCIWIRARVDEVLARGDSLLIMGDFNDGPGLDDYEKLFGKSGVEIVLGDTGTPAPLRLFDPHAALALQSRISLQPTSARFWHGPQKRYFEALLDFIMVSADLAARRPAWRIWHPFNDPACATPELREALLTASDHFPVTIDLPLAAAVA